jgi:Domain of unknown function (DUF4136)
MTFRPRRQQYILGTFLLLCSASACDCDDDDGLPPDEVYTRTQPGVEFSEYQTFRIDDELTEEELEDAGVDIDDFPSDVKLNIDTANDQARRELEDLGLTEVGEDEEADLVVGSLGKVDQDEAIYWECVPGYWWGYWGWYWDSCAWLEPEYVEWTVGSLAVALGDPKLEEIVFVGLLQGYGDGGDPDDVEDRIRDGVHEMFEDYPQTPQ